MDLSFMKVLVYTILVIGSYFLGSVPVAYILVKAIKGLDIRTIGSGNVGATNAGRIIGRKGFVIVLLLDALKGFIPIFLTQKFLLEKFNLNVVILVIMSVAIILGHTFSCFINFKGGKGIATGLGIYIALAPIPVLIAFLAFVVIVLITKMISAGSISAVVLLSILVTLMSDWHALWILTYLLALYIIYTHRSNIARIISGTENKISIMVKK